MLHTLPAHLGQVFERVVPFDKSECFLKEILDCYISFIIVSLQCGRSRRDVDLLLFAMDRPDEARSTRKRWSVTEGDGQRSV